MGQRTIALSIALSFFGCGASVDHLTASQHEAAAAREERAAELREEQYDPSAQRFVGTHVANDPFTLGMQSYNPTERELEAAREHRRHAAAHRARARELDAFEERACRDLSPSAREACPLLLGMVHVEDIEGGVRMTFAEGADIGPVMEEIRCHLAFAAARGREGMDACALYVYGVNVDVHGNVVELTTPEDDQVAELRERVRVQAP